MEGAMTLLAHGGMLPHYQPDQGQKEISPRRRGVKQGALLMLIGAVLVPLLGVFASFAPQHIEVVFEFFAALAAILCFVGGPLRMFYAALFEEGAPSRAPVMSVTYAPPAISAPSAPARLSALPPPAVHPASSWRPRPQTAEIAQPPSVTDNTTRLLDKPETES
jgi:hypothetical protein